MKTQYMALGLVMLALVGMGYATVSSVTLHFPADNAWDVDGDRTFNCTGVTNKTMVNSTLYIAGVANVTDSSVSNNTAVDHDVTGLDDACSGYVWLCEFCDNESSCLNATGRTIKVDSVAPSVAFTDDALNGVDEGDYIDFTTSDTCGVSSRVLYIDGSDKTTDYYDSSNERIDTHGMRSAWYTINLTVNDSAGNEGSAEKEKYRIDEGSGIDAVRPPAKKVGIPFGEQKVFGVKILHLLAIGIVGGLGFLWLKK